MSTPKSSFFNIVQKFFQKWTPITLFTLFWYPALWEIFTFLLFSCRGVPALVTKMRIRCASFRIFPHPRCAFDASGIQQVKMRIFWCGVLFYVNPMRIGCAFLDAQSHVLQTGGFVKNAHPMRIFRCASENLKNMLIGFAFFGLQNMRI